MSAQDFAIKSDNSCGKFALDTIKGEGFALTKGHSDKTQLTMRQAEHGRHDHKVECETAQVAPKPYVAELRYKAYC